jgi:hypothetical protein
MWCPIEYIYIINILLFVPFTPTFSKPNFLFPIHLNGYEKTNLRMPFHVHNVYIKIKFEIKINNGELLIIIWKH